MLWLNTKLKIWANSCTKLRSQTLTTYWSRMSSPRDFFGFRHGRAFKISSSDTLKQTESSQCVGMKYVACSDEYLVWQRCAKASTTSLPESNVFRLYLSTFFQFFSPLFLFKNGKGMPGLVCTWLSRYCIYLLWAAGSSFFKNLRKVLYCITDYFVFS